MKKLKPQLVVNKLYLLLLAFITLTALVIESCKKYNHTEQQAAITDPAVAQAKSWYESAYPVNTGKLNTQATGTNTDLSQLIKPDWQHTSSYVKFNTNVMEMSLAEAAKFSSYLKNMKTGHNSNKAYSKSSYLLLNNGAGYDAYIMTLIADSAYIKNDPGKLARNTYNKRDSDYSGLVLYFTPKGKYIGGWRYKNGHIITARSEPSKTQVQDIKTSKLKPTSVECYDVWWVTAYQGHVTQTEYLYSYCTGTDDGVGGGGGDGDDGNNNGEGGSSSPTPPPCPVNMGTHSPGNLTVNITKDPISTPPPPNDGGGFPPPQSQCVIEAPAPIITNNVKDPCLKKMVAAAITNNIVFDINNSMNGIFDSNTNFNLDFIDKPLASDLSGETNTLQASGTPASPGSQRVILTSLNLQISLNSSTLPNASKEFITATILHEVLHAYFRESHVAFDHQVMFQQYIPWYTSILHTMYPNLSQSDAEGLAYGGLQDSPSYIGSLTDLQKQTYANVNTAYKTRASGSPCN